MSVDGFLRLALGLFILAGYVAAYRYAERSAKSAEPKRSQNALLRAGPWVLLVVMPLSAITAIWKTRQDLILPILVGSTVNVFWFYAGYLGLLRNRAAVKQGAAEQGRGDRSKPLKGVWLGCALLAIACIGFVTATVRNVTTPQTLARLFVLVMLVALFLIYRGIKAAQR